MYYCPRTLGQLLGRRKRVEMGKGQRELERVYRRGARPVHQDLAAGPAGVSLVIAHRFTRDTQLHSKDGFTSWVAWPSQNGDTFNILGPFDTYDEAYEAAKWERQHLSQG